MKTYHYLVKGVVQGVFFRYHTKEAAEGYNLCGTVKNLASGDVEVFVQGEETQIKEFENFLASGPSLARVDQLIKKEIEQDQLYRNFSIIY